ncbi:DUF6166 domain-containing protein [Burkholderia cepacia]|uniref:DUF6166 domain-containing protein n=1 Tax=Burkholderia cepacia TaxID=292 RepID=UPI000A64150A|nr:DUF6166 domain-containing protein [Burkholderia cepacia]
MNNISERLRFLINTQTTSPESDDTSRRGEARTLALLERRTGIAQSRWRDFTRGKSRANEDLIEAACKLWPWFATWLVTGTALQVENLSPFDHQDAPSVRGDDVVLRRARRPNDANEISIPHVLKLRTPDAAGAIEPLTSDTLEWGYFGAGPCELAANVLYHFGVSAEQAKDLRIKFARDVVANLNRNEATISADTVNDWIKKNT